MTAKPEILIVEDDPVIGQNVKDALETEGFAVTWVNNVSKADAALETGTFDCVVLDIKLPDGSGLDVCKRLRTRDSHTPVLMLTAFDGLDDKVQGYGSGADDYLTKPFYSKELQLRINALIKRRGGPSQGSAAETHLTVADLTIDLRDRRVYRQGTEITLTPREFQVLVRLVRAKGELVTKQELVREIWGSVFDANTNTIEVYINFLRNKIDRPFSHQLIRTRIGYGYHIDAG